METPDRHIHPHDAADSAPHVSPIWQATIDKYYEELRREGVKAPAVDQDLWSIHTPDDLLQQIQPHTPQGSTPPANWMWSLRRLKSIILDINDFVAVIKLVLGMNGQVATIIWGSIRLILKFAQPVLPEIVDMLEELSRALPRFPGQELPLTKSLEDALLDAYTEIILFCAHSIGFFWNNPNITKSGDLWLRFSNDFSKVIAELRTSSRIVEERADMIRLTRDTGRIDTIDAIRDSRGHHSSKKNLSCYMIPYGLNLRFYGRTPETERLGKALDPRSPSGTLRVIAIHGTGGIGKTQLALHYANTSTNLYDAVIWIPSEKQMKVMQTLSTFSRRLGISGSEDVEDDYQSIQKVRDWLNTSGKTFLLVFDNVENDAILNQIWPTSARGSVIITCRSQSVASKRTADSIHLQGFTPETGLQVLVSLTGLRSTNADEEAAARELNQLLGGHPLAMVHIGEFIRDRGYSYQELLPVYKKSAQKIFARSGVPSQYGHTLVTVWDVSFETLSIESKVLLGILAFFDPDIIPESILSNTRAGVTDSGMQFLFDEFDFGDAIIGLTKASLIHRLSSHKAISIHRLVQFTVFSRLSAMDKSKYLDFAVRVLSYGFPNSWNDRTSQQGHGWESWETCGAILPHVSWLIRLTKEHSLQVTNVELLAELIFRTGTYLWEKEQPTMVRSFIEYGLSLDIKQSTPNYAQAYRLLGHIGLDMAQPRAALAAYEKALAARETLEEPNSPPIADVYDSISCSYTEQGRVAEAFEYLSKAANIHRAHNPLHMGRTQAIYAMTYLRAEKPGEALTALKSCWKLQGLDEEQISQSKYPKHSGDILLLSRIKYAQGLKEEAQQLASRTISIRRGLFGDKGPRVADSMFTVARMLEADGEEVLAAKLLRSVADMSRGVSEMQGHLARSLWFLAAIESRLGDNNQAEMLRVQARRERQGIVGRETTDEDSDDSFMRLVGWMLW